MPWQKLFLGYILGIWTLKYPWAGVCGLILILLFLPFRDVWRNLLLLGVFVAALFSAWFRLPEAPVQIPEPISSQERVWLKGQVDAVSYLPGCKQRIILKNLIIEPDREPVNLPGRLVWTWQEAPEDLVPGQEVQAHVRIRPVHGLANFGVWNSEFFWRTQGVFWRSFTRGEHFWHRLEETQNKSFALRSALKARALDGLDLQGLDPERKNKVQGLGLALFFGDRSLLDQELLESVRLASLAHTLALSGLHLGIMAGMGFMLAGALGYIFPRLYLVLPFVKLGMLLAVPICLVYLWMGQFQPTLIRAGIMLACWGLYLLANQRRVLLDGLFMAAALITLHNPWSVFDLRLQLSVIAVAGIALILPLMERLLRSLEKGRVSALVRYFLALSAVTLAANLVLLPIQAWTFNYMSPHLYLNLIWLPLLGLLVLPAGFAGLFISLVPGLSPAGDFLLGVSGHALSGFIALMENMRARDLLHPVITYRPSFAEILAYYLVPALLLYIRWVPWRKERILVGLGIMACLVLVPWMGRAWDQGVTLRVLDVGQGQGLVLDLPRNKRILVDGGGSWNPEFDPGRAVVTPSLTWRTRPESLVKIILSHAHVDHYGGLVYPLKYLGAEKFLHNGIWPDEQDRHRLESALERRGVQEGVLVKGEVLELGGGINLEVLHPEDPHIYDLLNDSSLVLRLLWNDRPLALIPGDIEAEGIRDLLESGKDLGAQILLVPHHGSRSSADPEFYSRVDPDMAVVSRGFMNRFGVPHPEVLELIEDKGIRLFDTAVHGETVLSWDSPESGPRIRWARSRTGPGGVPYWY